MLIELTTFFAGFTLLLAGGPLTALLLLYFSIISARACSSKCPDFEVAF
jgi:hypothetical protein